MKTLYGIILSIASAQGFTMGLFLLFYKKRKLYSNVLLSFLLFVLAYVLLTESLRVFGGLNIHTISYYFFLEIGWLIGPLIFLYIKSLYHPDDRLSWSDAIYGIPVIIEIACSAFIKSQNLYWDGTRDSLTWLGFYGYKLWMHTPLDLVITAILIIVAIHQGQKMIGDGHAWLPSLLSEVKRSSRLSLILMIYKACAVLAIIITMIDFCFFNFAFNPIYVYPVYLGLGLLTYWLALHGILAKDQVLVKRRVEHDERLTDVIHQLDYAMKLEKLYMEPTLTASSLASRTGLKGYMISRALNNMSGKSVTQYINEYRVAAFIEKVNDPALSHFTILALALDCGFNSKASANRIIKKMTGQSPSELRDK